MTPIVIIPPHEIGSERTKRPDLTDGHLEKFAFTDAIWLGFKAVGWLTG